jgi:hypothetical protein
MISNLDFDMGNINPGFVEKSNDSSMNPMDFEL